jgi:hypothetical protein
MSERVLEGSDNTKVKVAVLSHEQIRGLPSNYPLTTSGHLPILRGPAR